MASFTVTDEADADIQEIWFYTMETWGLAQAERSVTELDSKFALLADQPGMGRPWEYLKKPVRLSRYQAHIVVYEKTSYGVDIVRVLSARQNWQAILGG